MMPRNKAPISPVKPATLKSPLPKNNATKITVNNSSSLILLTWHNKYFITGIARGNSNKYKECIDKPLEFVLNKIASAKIS